MKYQPHTTMKITLTTEQAADILLKDNYQPWTTEGAYALLEYIEQLDEDTGTESELDPIALRCEFTEYRSAVEALAEYTSEKVEDEDEAMEQLMNETTVIDVPEGGVIIQNF